MNPRPLRVLDLFSGIGGFSLGLERAGMKTVAFCEIDPFCRKVLAKHWPEVPIYEDIRTLSADVLERDGIAVDAICGGFPCQDISLAGKQEGIRGERSSLWFEYARLIGEIRPSVVIVENVSALLGNGMADVLGTLSTLGYDAEWDVIPASAIGGLHRRERLWITAYPNANGVRPQRVRIDTRGPWTSEQFAGLVQDIASVSLPAGRSGGVSDGVPDRAHRLKALGNSVVPQVVELIGKAIMQAHYD